MERASSVMIALPSQTARDTPAHLEAWASASAEPCTGGSISMDRGCRVMTESFANIWEIAQQKKLPLRTAAFVKALQSVTRAHLHRGFD